MAKFHIGKQSKLIIEDAKFRFGINQRRVAAERVMDVIYVIHTSIISVSLRAADTVKAYTGYRRLSGLTGCIRASTCR